MDFLARARTIEQARSLYAQARDALAAQEETAAFGLYSGSVKLLQSIEDGGGELDTDEIAEFLETDIGTLETFREELTGAAVRHAFMQAVEAATDPAKAMLYIRAVEETYRLYGDEEMGFDEFCHETGIVKDQFDELKADIRQRLDATPGWESTGEKMVKAVVGATLRRAFKWAAEFSATKPARALQLLDAIEWVAKKMDNAGGRDFMHRAGLDERLISRVRGQISPQF